MTLHTDRVRTDSSTRQLDEAADRRIVYGTPAVRCDHVTAIRAVVLSQPEVAISVLHINGLPFINGGQSVECTSQIVGWISLVVIIASTALASIADPIRSGWMFGANDRGQFSPRTCTRTKSNIATL